MSRVQVNTARRGQVKSPEQEHGSEEHEQSNGTEDGRVGREAGRSSNSISIGKGGKMGTSPLCPYHGSFGDPVSEENRERMERCSNP